MSERPDSSSYAALVVGAGDATGGAVARRFAREGYATCLVRRKADRLAPLVDRIEDHPIDLLIQLRFRVTLNTDNRLMSGVSMSSEMAALVEAFGYGWERLRWLTVNGMKSSFLPFRERLQIIEQVIKPRFAPLEAWATEPPV